MKRKNLTEWQKQKLGISADPKAKLKALQAKATRLCRPLVMERWGNRCAKCRCRGQTWYPLEFHHLIGRGRWAHRWNPENGMALCREHHNWATLSPTEFDDWLRDNHHCIWVWRNQHRRDSGKRTVVFLEQVIAELENR